MIEKEVNGVKAILIDNNHRDLYTLEKQLQSLSDIEIVGKHVQPLDGARAVVGQEIDVVFLDIILTGMNGIELAKHLKEYQPNLKIVFVTSNDEFAIDAFKLNALDYVLKPVKLERLQKTVSRIYGEKCYN